MKQLISKAVMISLVAISANSVANNLIFSCTTSNDKTMSLSKDHDDIVYNYGKNFNKPDITIKVKKSKTKIDLSNPAGRYLISSIEIPNGKYKYVISTNTDRNTDQHESSTGIDVVKNDQILASIPCKKGSEVGTLVALDD